MFWTIILPSSSTSSSLRGIAVLLLSLGPLTLNEEGTVIFQDIINYYFCDTASNSMRLESSGTAVVYSEYLARHVNIPWIKFWVTKWWVTLYSALYIVMYGSFWRCVVMVMQPLWIVMVQGYESDYVDMRTKICVCEYWKCN